MSQTVAEVMVGVLEQIGVKHTHLVAGLYEASRDYAPVLALSSDMPRKFQGTDYIQTTKPDLLPSHRRKVISCATVQT